jgi:hypothetical protein
MAIAVMVVEPLVLPVSVDVDVSGKPSGAPGADATGWCGREHTPYNTLEEHY